MVSNWLAEADVRLVRAPNPSPMTLDGTNTYIVGRGNVVVIDPGPELPAHLDAIVEAVKGDRIVGLLVTHGHSDHAPGALMLAERLGSPVVGHPRLAGVTRPIADRARFEFGSRWLTALHTPGHAVDHVCYLLDDRGVLFSGDLIAGSGTVVVGDRPGDLSRYMASLRVVRDVGSRVISPGHGPLVDDATPKIDEYIAHRQMRIDQVLAAVSDGADVVDAIVRRVYPGLAAELVRPATRNVLACLEALEADGIVSVSDARWRVRGDRA
jgi:glyoxylase-like metal-dependent hydrolase (beta-lactamase superfamily II)